MSRRASVLVAFALLIAGCSPAPPPPPPAPAGPAPITEADKAAMRAVNDKATALMSASPNDIEGMVKIFYAADAMVLAPNAPMVQGHAAIIAAFKQFPPITSAKFNDVEIEGYGDTAWARGTYTLTLTPPGAKPINDSGKYIEIWKKQADGTWKVTRDCFNSDVPVATGGGD